ncbi:MAG: PleD family two-component system response regulator [Alphaproteobacteria bacterium]|nr:PleD family two-component system response regulator [Alphaproteobacteria bacterium]
MTATILVVDDIEQNIRVLEAKLLVEYYTVMSATSGSQALDILSKEKIDIILLDGMMPGMDGFETCKKIKSNPETMQIPVIMVTALSDIEDRVKGLESGADEFLTKPVNDHALLARVRSLSRIKSMIDELRLRNQTSADLGGNIVEISDSFEDCKILIIDDDIVQAKNLIRSLKKLTDQVNLISNPNEINTIQQYNTPDSIIISCQLTSADPLRIVVNLRVKEELRYTSFVLMTEDHDIEVVSKGVDLGVSDYFAYPVDENELLARMKTQLKRKKYQDSLRDGLDKTMSLSIKDSLSGLYNRRYFDIHIERIIEKAKKESKSMALLMFDIDHFKEVNDLYGHQAGDIVIQDVAMIIKKILRITDLVARYGGEEFVAILYDVSTQQSLEIAERIRESVERHEFKIQERLKPLSKTISIGICHLIEIAGESSITMLKKADEALYESKETGRNKVSIYDEN